MVDQSFDEIYNDSSIESKAKEGAKEYFKTHQALFNEELNTFLSLVGLDAIWNTNEEKQTIWELFIKHAVKGTNTGNDVKAIVNETSVTKSIEELFHSDTIENNSFWMNESLTSMPVIEENKEYKIAHRQSRFKKEADEEIIIEEQLSPRSSMKSFFNRIDLQTLKKFKTLNIILPLYDEISTEKVTELLTKYKFISLPKDQVMEYIKLLSQHSSQAQAQLTGKMDKEVFNYANETVNLRLEDYKKTSHTSLRLLEGRENKSISHLKSSNASTKEEDSSDLLEKIKKIDSESIDCITAIRKLIDTQQFQAKADTLFLLTELTSLIKAKISNLSRENSKTVFIEISKNSMFHNTLTQYVKSKNNLYSMIDLQDNLDRIVGANRLLIEELNKKTELIKALNAKIADQNVELLVNMSHISQLEEFSKEMQKENIDLKEEVSKAGVRYSTMVFNKKDETGPSLIDNVKGFIQELEVKNRKYNEMLCKKNLECANLRKDLSQMTIQCNYLKEENRRMTEFDLCKSDSIAYLHEQLFSSNLNRKQSLNQTENSSFTTEKRKSLSMPNTRIATENNKEFNDTQITFDDNSQNEAKSKDSKDNANSPLINANSSLVSMTNKSDKSLISVSAYGLRKRKTKGQWAFKEERDSHNNWDNVSNNRTDIFSLKESLGDKIPLETPNNISYIDSQVDLSIRERRYTNLTNMSEKNKEKSNEDNSGKTPINKSINDTDPIDDSDSQHDLKENVPTQKNQMRKENDNNTIREEEDEDKSEQSSQYHFCNSNRNSSVACSTAPAQVRDKAFNSLNSLRLPRSNQTAIDSSFLFSHLKDNLLLGDTPAYDFLNLRNSKLVDSLIYKNKDTLVPMELFSDCVFYFQDSKRIKCLLIITAKTFYIFREYDINCRVRINRKYMGTISISSKYFNVISFHFNTGEDIIIDIYRRMELLYYLRDLYRVKKFNKLRFKFTDQFCIGTKTVNVIKEKIFQITPNLENAQKMGYLSKYNDTFFSNSFSEKYVVLCCVGLMYFDDITKPPKGIIPIIGTKIKTVVCNTENDHYYCFQLTLANNEMLTFGSTIKEELECWVVELRKFTTAYNQKMKGIDTVQK